MSSPTTTPGQLAAIGVTGLAVMGSNLARNLARHGHVVALHNRSITRTTALVDAFGSEGTFLPSDSVEDFVASLERPRRIIIMVKAGRGHRRGHRRAGAAPGAGRHHRRRRQRALRATPAAVRPGCATWACTSSAPGSPAARWAP